MRTDSQSLLPPAQRAIDGAARWLLDQQHADGCWCGELEGDSILQSEYILLRAWMGQERADDCRAAAQRLLQQQQPHGGWSLFPGGPLDVSGSVKAYFALKLTGHSGDSEPLSRARTSIREAGGADAVNSFTRFYLALLGQVSYEDCPAVPPEALLLPEWSPVNIYRVSAWTRTILVPLSVMWAFRPQRRLEPERGIGELMIRPPRQWPPLRSPGAGRRRLLSWETLFRRLDAALKLAERLRMRPLRRAALQRAESWMLERFEDSDGLGAIFPPIIWSVVALKCLGHADDSPPLRYCLRQLDELKLRSPCGAVRLQPCKSPVWDTALSVRALAAAGADPQSPPMRRAVAWLLEKQTTRRGDWSQASRAEPGGWFFEHRNQFYPDIDDTIMVLMALRESHGAELPAGVAAACERGRRWVLAMQNRDGGWGAFDRDNDAAFLCQVPFADHNAMIDPSTPDIAARVLEAMVSCSMRPAERPLQRAVDFVLRSQEADGSWFGRWGVNYIYGTWQALVGLAAAGVPCGHSAVQRGRRWLLDHQQPEGGWGETPDSYQDDCRPSAGPPTPSQTAWALLGLLASGPHDHPAVLRGVRFLLASRNQQGVWDEPQFTGTGFPLVFYLRYHLYPVYFPLQALAAWRRAAQAAAGARPADVDSRRSALTGSVPC